MLLGLWSTISVKHSTYALIIKLYKKNRIDKEEEEEEGQKIPWELLSFSSQVSLSAKYTANKTSKMCSHNGNQRPVKLEYRGKPIKSWGKNNSNWEKYANSLNCTHWINEWICKYFLFYDFICPSPFSYLLCFSIHPAYSYLASPTPYSIILSAVLDQNILAIKDYGQI